MAGGHGFGRAHGHDLPAALSLLPVTETFYRMAPKGYSLEGIARELNRRANDYLPSNRFVALLGAAIASADQFAPRVTLSQFAAMITSDENTYFLRSFDALGVPEPERLAPSLTPQTQAFQQLMHEAAQSLNYANCIAVLAVAEGLYLDWADQPAKQQLPLPARFEHAEWITLHANDFFRGFVAWLRSELDRVGPALSDAARAEAAGYFQRAVQLERQFFDHVYA